MKKNKKRILIVFITCILLLGIVLTIYFISDSKKGELIKLSYNDIEEKINNKESFVLCISQSTCTHCETYKPRLERVASKYGIDLYYSDVDLYNEKDSEKFDKLFYFSGTPVTIFIENGEEKTTANRLSGAVSYDKLVKKLKENNFIK